MQENLKLLKTELYDDGSYTEYWQYSYSEGYAKTYSSNNKLIFVETIAASENGLRTITLIEYCYKDNLDNLFFPSTIYSPSVPEWKYEVHTMDPFDRCVLIEHYDIPPSDNLLGRTVINYSEDEYRTEFYIDYSVIGATSIQTVYDSNDRKISEVEYFDPDAQHKARVTTFKYPDDNSVATTMLTYYQTEIDLHNVRASQCIENSLTGYFKEINYIDYEMTQIRDMTEFQIKEDDNEETIHIVYNSDEDDDFSYKQISVPGNSYTKKEWYYDPKFTQLCFVDEIEYDENGQTRFWTNKEYSKEGELISVTKQEFDENGDIINNTKDDSINDTYFENIDKIVLQLFEEKYREYVLRNLKTYYTITYQSLEQDDCLALTDEKQKIVTQYITEWVLWVIQRCIKAKISDKYLDTIIQSTTMIIYEVIKQNLKNNDEIPIELIPSSTNYYVEQLCKKLFKDLEDNERITEECCINVLQFMQTLDY